MAYEKYTWVDGELITAEKLNHMEDGIAEGGGGDVGYTYSVEETFLFNETFEPGREQGAPYLQAQLNYSDSITADLLKVEFDGVEYICPLENVQDGQRYTYGGYTFEKYPFVIVSNQSVHQNWVYTPTSGEHSIEVSRCEESVSTTRSFEKAVKSAADDGVEIVDIVQTGTGASQSTPIINFSYDDVGQIMQKYNNGKAFVRLQLLDNPSLNYYTNGAHLYVDTFYADWSSMTGDYYLLHASGTSSYNVSGNNIRVYDIKLEVGRSSNRLTIRAIQISAE